MDQVKIGKLIAMLRKQKGLTQGELGAKVGVGDRAVSKWERGITCPDISIINDLSKILGITSDELLSGELSKESQAKLKTTKPNTKIFIIVAILFIAFAILSYFTIRNKSDVYNIKSMTEDYTIEGKVIFDKDKTNIIINHISIANKDINEISIKSYEYLLMSENNLILKKSNSNDDPSQTIKTIEEFCKDFQLNYSVNGILNKKDIISKDMTLRLLFTMEDDTIITENVKLLLKK